MIHPEHGATHAYDTGEIERLKGLGWAVEVPADPKEQPPVVTLSQHMAAVAKRKPGRPAKAK
jgi:hypothetical protein